MKQIVLLTNVTSCSEYAISLSNSLSSTGFSFKRFIPFAIASVVENVYHLLQLCLSARFDPSLGCLDVGVLLLVLFEKKSSKNTEVDIIALLEQFHLIYGWILLRLSMVFYRGPNYLGCNWPVLAVWMICYLSRLISYLDVNYHLEEDCYMVVAPGLQLGRCFLGLYILITWLSAALLVWRLSCGTSVSFYVLNPHAKLCRRPWRHPSYSKLSYLILILH